MGDEPNELSGKPGALAYADGSPIQEGDWAHTEKGSVLARVSRIIDTAELAAQERVQGLGVVLDAQPKGFVFLSKGLLDKDPLQFVRRGPDEQTHVLLSLSFGIALVMLLPAFYSWFSALYSAFTTGEVLVISLGRTETYRKMVPWPQGWARFAGPIILLVSLMVRDGSRGVTLRWWLAGTGTAAGLVLLAFSAWFISPGRALALTGFLGFIASAAAVDKKFGRGVAFLFIVACCLVLVWKVTS